MTQIINQLLVATLKVRLANRQKQHSITPLNLQELKEEKAVQFAAEMTNRFTTLVNRSHLRKHSLMRSTLLYSYTFRLCACHSRERSRGVTVYKRRCETYPSTKPRRLLNRKTQVSVTVDYFK